MFPSTPPSIQDWSRDDLNGDGFTGGPTIAAFDLDTTRSTRGDAPHLSTATQTIDGSQVSFHENAATDKDILCYYAYSPLYTGDPSKRDTILADQCVDPKIAFQGPGTSNVTSSVYTINPDGSGLTPLTNNSFSDGQPAWSPDRTQIAYLCGCGEWRAIRPDGTGDRLIWDPDPGAFGGPDRIGSAEGARFSWAPDGSRLVVSVSPSGIGPPVEIWTVGRDGSHPTRLTTGAIDQSPEFSPHGTKIVFERGISGNDEIWSMNPDDSGQTLLTTGHTDTTPEFSPDGTKIVFVRIVNTTRQLFTMNADGSDQTQIPTGRNAFFPAWSR